MENLLMSDILAIIAITGFFAITLFYLRGCESLRGGEKK